MSDVQSVEKTKKKPTRITIAVSQKNFNRFKAHTHTLERILQLEGHTLIREKGLTTVVMGDKQVALTALDLHPRSKEVVIHAAPPAPATQGEKS